MELLDEAVDQLVVFPIAVQGLEGIWADEGEGLVVVVEGVFDDAGAVWVAWVWDGEMSWVVEGLGLGQDEALFVALFVEGVEGRFPVEVDDVADEVVAEAEVVGGPELEIESHGRACTPRVHLAGCWGVHRA